MPIFPLDEQAIVAAADEPFLDQTSMVINQALAELSLDDDDDEDPESLYDDQLRELIKKVPLD